METSVHTTKLIVLIGTLSLAVLASFTLLGRPREQTANAASEVKGPELSKVKNPQGTNCPECIKALTANKHSAPVVTENPNSPAYFQIDKNSAYVYPAVKAGDNGNLLEVQLTAPGTIISVDPDCHGTPCGWVHGCDGTQCLGHNVPVEYHNNNTAIWWGWTNTGDNCVLVFTVHYQ